MTTFPVLDRDALADDDQRAFWDEITRGPRGFFSGGPDSKRVPDLYNAWLQFPALGRAMFSMGDAVRGDGRLPGRLRELICLTTSCALGARVEYDFHKPFAREEGLSDAVIEAIGAGTRPPFEDEVDRAVYQANLHLLETARLPDEDREQLIGMIGFDGLMRVVATVTLYMAVAFTTNLAGVKLADDFSADENDLNRWFTGKTA